MIAIVLLLIGIIMISKTKLSEEETKNIKMTKLEEKIEKLSAWKQWTFVYIPILSLAFQIFSLLRESLFSKGIKFLPY